MSHYDFLKEVGIDGKICRVGKPITYSDGTFSVEVTDNEGWASIIFLFDENGNYLDRSE